MDRIHTIILIYVAVLSVIAFCLMGIDKKCAERKEWRVKELTLFIFALIGGGIGAFSGMLIFRHKTKHWYFVVFFTLFAVVQTAAMGFLFLS